MPVERVIDGDTLDSARAGFVSMGQIPPRVGIGALLKPLKDLRNWLEVVCG
jgi:hypothetical protein